MTTVQLTADNIIAIVNNGARSFLHSILKDVEVGEQICILGNTKSPKGSSVAKLTVQITSKRLFSFPMANGYRVLYDFRLLDLSITLKENPQYEA